MHEISCIAHCKSILPGLFSADGAFGLSKNVLIIICCVVGVLGLVVIATAAMKLSERRKQEKTLGDAAANGDDGAIQLVTEFHFESPETSPDIMQIESKVRPSVEEEEFKNDYIEYHRAAQEDDYIDYTGL